jgi:hypothetical protein
MPLSRIHDVELVRHIPVRRLFRQPLAEYIQVRPELCVVEQAHLHLDLLRFFCSNIPFLFNREE